MDKPNLSSAPATEPSIAEQAAYVTPAVIYEAPLEVRAGTLVPSMPDPLNLFGTNEK